jgi:hypothetical protein
MKPAPAGFVFHVKHLFNLLCREGCASLSALSGAALIYDAHSVRVSAQLLDELLVRLFVFGGLVKQHLEYRLASGTELRFSMGRFHKECFT